MNERTNNALTQSFAVNDLNELSSASQSGTLTVAGSTTELGNDVTNVSVNGEAAYEYTDGTFAAPGFMRLCGTDPFPTEPFDKDFKLPWAPVTNSPPPPPPPPFTLIPLRP